MIKSILVALLVMGLWGVSAGALRAQSSNGVRSSAQSSQDNKQITDADIEALRRDLREKKKETVAANLNLTPDQATKFWPVYDQYVADLTKINDEKYAILKEFANNWGKITDVQAESLTQRALDVDNRVAQLRIKYYPVFRKVLPAQQTATYFQIDRRLQMMVDLHLTSQIPLLQSQ
jgi:hypothetical protein